MGEVGVIASRGPSVRNSGASEGMVTRRRRSARQCDHGCLHRRARSPDSAASRPPSPVADLWVGARFHPRLCRIRGPVGTWLPLGPLPFRDTPGCSDLPACRDSCRIGCYRAHPPVAYRRTGTRNSLRPVNGLRCYRRCRTAPHRPRRPRCYGLAATAPICLRLESADPPPVTRTVGLTVLAHARTSAPEKPVRGLCAASMMRSAPTERPAPASNSSYRRTCTGITFDVFADRRTLSVSLAECATISQAAPTHSDVIDVTSDLLPSTLSTLTEGCY